MSGTQPPAGPGARPALFSRLATAVVYAVTGRAPNWFGPNEPIAPQAPPGIGGRQFDFPQATNLNNQPRQDEEITAEQLRNLANNCDVVALAIQTRKDQLAPLKYQFQMKNKEARGAPDPRLDMLAEFFKKPDREHDWNQWIGALIDDLLVIDAATVFPRQTMGGQPYGFEFVDGGTIKRVIDDFGRTPLPPAPAYQQIFKGLPAVNYTRDELLYFPRNLRTYKLYGMSPVQQVVMTVNIALRRTLHQLEYYTAGTVPDVLIGTPPTWSPEQIGDYQRYFDELLTDNTAARRRARFVPGEIAKSIIQTKEAALKDDFDEWLARVVSYAFSLSPQWAVKAMNRATSETAQGMANAEGLAPLREWVKSVVDRCIEIGWGWTDIEFAWWEEEETNPKEQADVAIGYLKMGVLTINEVRADIGRDPVEGGDTPLIYTPTGAVPLAQALAPPPPPPQIGHNGGPAMDPEKPSEADQEEALLKAASLEARLTEIWAHFFRQQAPRVAEALTAVVPDVIQKADGDGKPADGEQPDEEGQDLQDLSDLARAERAARQMAQPMPPKVETVIDEAVKAMPWPTVQSSTATVLQEAIMAGSKEGEDALTKITGIKVKNNFRMANPLAIAAAEEQAAKLITGISETTRSALNKLVVTALTEGWSHQMLIDRIVKDHAFSEERAKIITQTELRRAQVQGNIDQWRANAARGSRTMKRVVLGMNENHCIACETAVREGPIPLDDSWSVGFAPPFHPGCYCNISPVTPSMKEWPK
jgi:hypothetical protein